MAVPTGKCAGKTGKEEEVQVRHGEGVAIRTGPEPCVGTREGVGEASVGEHIGQPLSRENLSNLGADVFESTEGNTDGGDSASRRPQDRESVSQALDRVRHAAVIGCLSLTTFGR